MSKPTIPSADTPPFSLPLSVQEFERALSIGHGRAWLHASRHGVDGLHDAITHALLHSLAFDVQCEGDRGPWMMGLVDAANAGDLLYPKIIERVHEPPEGDYASRHMYQRCTLMGALAKRGVSAARAVLDELFTANRKEHPNELLGAPEIMDVDGEQGLVRVCSVLGHEAHASSATSIDDWLLNVFDDNREEGAAIKALEAARKKDPGVDHFLTIWEAEQARRAAAKKAKKSRSSKRNPTPFGNKYESVPPAYHSLPVEQVIDWIRNAPTKQGDGRGWLRGWGVKASETALGKVVSELDSAKDPVHLRRYLSIFSRRPMPRVSDHVIRLAEDSNDEVRSRAYAALQNVSDPRIRQVGLRSLAPELMIRGSLELWESSYETGDDAAIEQALFVPSDVGELHTIVFDLASVCAKVMQSECLGLLLFVYEYSPCGNCRQIAVETLEHLGITPSWLKEERPYDSMESIREKFGGPKLED